jgi:Arabinose efflux permease
MVPGPRAFAGISGGVLGSVIMAIVGDVIPAQRRGAATGTIMTAFSLAAIAGVPAGVMLGAHFTWAAPFYLLVVLSLLIWVAGWQLVPSLAEHLGHRKPALGEVLPDLWRLLSNPRHMNAFALTFMMMIAHTVVIPFISPVLVANHGVSPAQLSWLYMAGGAATFFTSRRVGQLADRFGTRRVFRIAVLISFLPVLFVTHLPDFPFYALAMFFPFFYGVDVGAHDTDASTPDDRPGTCAPGRVPKRQQRAASHGHGVWRVAWRLDAEQLTDRPDHGLRNRGMARRCHRPDRSVLGLEGPRSAKRITPYERTEGQPSRRKLK